MWPRGRVRWSKSVAPLLRRRHGRLDGQRDVMVTTSTQLAHPGRRASHSDRDCCQPSRQCQSTGTRGRQLHSPVSRTLDQSSFS